MRHAADGQGRNKRRGLLARLTIVLSSGNLVNLAKVLSSVQLRETVVTSCGNLVGTDSSWCCLPELELDRPSGGGQN